MVSICKGDSVIASSRVPNGSTIEFSLAQGYYEARLPGAAATQVTVIAGARSRALLVIEGVGHLALTVVDSRGVRLAAQALVLAEVGGSPVARTTTDESGYALWPGVAAQSYEVFLEGTPDVGETVVVERDRTTHLTLLVPTADEPHDDPMTCGITIFTVGPGNTPWGHATVMLYDDMGQQLDDVQSDAQGCAHFYDLEPGVYGIGSPCAVADEFGLLVDAGLRKSVVLHLAK